MAGLARRNPYETEFHQAVHEVAETVIPFIRKNPKYAESIVFERMTEPEKVFIFRVSWKMIPETRGSTAAIGCSSITP